MAKQVRFDEIGYWSEIKLDIVRSYAVEYSKIIRNQGRFAHYYIDAFSGPGRHLRKGTGEMIAGSPLNALAVQPPFSRYWFIDLDADKVDFLRSQIGDRGDVEILTGDCNVILQKDIFPRIRYEDFARALCLIDPYGLDLDWAVILQAGRSRTIEVFLNFPVADMNRNVLWRNPEGVDARDAQRMTRYWGDESWRKVAYTTEGTLFGWEEKVADNAAIAEAYRQRLLNVAGFQYVPHPIPMRNNEGAAVYYLYFASPNRVANKIVTHIFDKYRDRGRRP
jgi:three-Cys-motif partner protein